MKGLGGLDLPTCPNNSEGLMCCPIVEFSSFNIFFFFSIVSHFLRAREKRRKSGRVSEFSDSIIDWFIAELNFLSGVSLFISLVVFRLTSSSLLRLASAKNPPALLNVDFFFKLERRYRGDLWRRGELYLLSFLLCGEFLFLAEDLFDYISKSTCTKSSIPENWHRFFFF